MQTWKTVLSEDLIALGLPASWRYKYLLTNRIACFMRLLRKAEYRRIESAGMWRFHYLCTRWRYERLSERLGFDIPLGVLGPGASIAHRGTIVINGQARIGKNCRLHPGLVIGASHGLAPEIGDNVFIGPNVSIIGNIRVGHGAKIGPQSLVNFSVQDGATVVAERAQDLKLIRLSTGGN